jgi:hypothetical protein
MITVNCIELKWIQSFFVCYCASACRHRATHPTQNYIICYTTFRTKRNVEKYNPPTFKENGSQMCFRTRETREGRPLLAVKTEVKGDSKSINESLVGLLALSCKKKRFLFCLGCSSRPSAKYFFLTVHYLNSFVPIDKQARQPPCWVACLLVCVSGQNP